MDNVIIGKRITFGAAIGGLVAFAAYVWNLKNPDAQLSVPAVQGLTTALIAIGQVIIVNKLGVTTK